ncbi:ecto-NOX disulfide-thiol exchanger 1-like [Diadema antillarum]|uniref:ecto-NOX disulfide-thiol exchanger 1-like n=1 Tax=Diadema antillarum TaxID=105358 RepID=UPI003A856E52
MNVIEYGHGSHGSPDRFDDEDRCPDPSANDMPLQFSTRNGPMVIEQVHDVGDVSPTLSRHFLTERQYLGRGGEVPVRRGRRSGSSFLDDSSELVPGMMHELGQGATALPADLLTGEAMSHGYGAAHLYPGLVQGTDYRFEGQGSVPAGAISPLLGTTKSADMLEVSRKSVFHFKGFTVFQPSVNPAPPTPGERPPGCKTIFVEGFPDAMKVEMLEDLFARLAGEIVNIRLGKQNVCFIRFADEFSVQAAMSVTGYTVRIGASLNPENNGRLRVEYAHTRHDVQEYEREQRRKVQERRQRESERDNYSPGEQRVVPGYSRIDGLALSAKLKNPEVFPQAANQLVLWLERGECDKKNAGAFYSMVQSTHFHVRRLVGEKAQWDQQLGQMQLAHRTHIMGINTQYSLIEQVLVSACKQRVWDHFSKAQRKNIEGWKQQIKSLHQQQQDAMGLGEKGEAEMDLSDDDDGTGEAKRIKIEQNVPVESTKPVAKQPDPPDNELQLQVQALMHQNNVLRSQLEALRTGEEGGGAGTSGTSGGSGPTQPSATPPSTPNEETETQIKALQHSLLAMQQQLQETKNKLKKEESLRKEAEEKVKTLESVEKEEKSDDGLSLEASFIAMDTKRASMIGLLSIFLNVHPFGASTEYLWSYMQRVNPSITMSDIEALLNAYPTLFRQDLFGVGATLEKRWRYTLFAKFTESGKN